MTDHISVPRYPDEPPHHILIQCETCEGSGMVECDDCEGTGQYYEDE